MIMAEVSTQKFINITLLLKKILLNITDLTVMMLFSMFRNVTVLMRTFGYNKCKIIYISIHIITNIS